MNVALIWNVPAAAPAQPSLFMGMLPMVLIFGIFYFLLIAPARKKQKAHGEMIQNLKMGDHVITNGGIHGTVVGVSDAVIQLRIADQIKVDVSRSAVSAHQNPEG